MRGVLGWRRGPPLLPGRPDPGTHTRLVAGPHVPANDAFLPIRIWPGLASAASATSRGLPRFGGPTALARWMMTRSTGQWLGAPVNRFPAGWTMTRLICRGRAGERR